VLSITLGSIGAYAITRLRFAGRRLIAIGLVCTYLIPQALLFIPLYQVVANLGLTDTVGALILIYPTITLPFCTWLLMSYFKSIPLVLEVAALIDGCNRFGVLLAHRAALITALPPVIMYTLAQRLVIKGLVVGGVKG
jgi:multiple sugar transport system permease protein